MEKIGLNRVGKPDKAMSSLRAGMEANLSMSVSLSAHLLIILFPSATHSFLTFAYAEARELKKSTDTSTPRSTSPSRPFKSNSGASPPPSPLLLFNQGRTLHRCFWEWQRYHAGIQSTNMSFNSSSSLEHKAEPTEPTDRKTEYGSAYIAYIHFGRRMEGVKASRVVFGRAREGRQAGKCMRLLVHIYRLCLFWRVTFHSLSLFRCPSTV